MTDEQDRDEAADPEAGAVDADTDDGTADEESRSGGATGTQEVVEEADDATAEEETMEEDESDEGDEDVLGPTSTSLLAKVALADETLADDLEDHLVELESAREEAETAREEADERADELAARLRRSKADFQNYKKRAKKRQEQLEARATEDLVSRLVDVRDNLKRALDSEYDDAESLREGVELTLREFDRVLDEENVTEIDPEPGAEVDPQRHEVMMRVDSDQPADTVAEVYRSGYEMGGKVIRAAQVTVSDGTSADDDDKPDDGSEDEGEETEE